MDDDDDNIPLMRGRLKRLGRPLNHGTAVNCKRTCDFFRLVPRSDYSSSECIAVSKADPYQGRPNFSFNRLTALARLDGLKIMEILSQRVTQTQFIEVCSKQQLKKDWIILVIKILSKMSCAEFHEITATLLMKVCSHEFLNKLLLFIVEIDEDKNETRQRSLKEIFENLAHFFQGLLKLLPTLACERLGKLIQQTTLALNGVVEFEGLEILNLKLLSLQDELNTHKEQRKKGPEVLNAGQATLCPAAALYSFRELESFPLAEDLICSYRPYLRPNITVGAYENVEHYLDVHFRLMREDFICPLRQGIDNYKKKLQDFGTSPKKGTKGHKVRIYKSVEFVGMRAEKDQLCIEICFDAKKSFCKKINWDHCKHFMKGSLLVLTKDNFVNIILMMVSKRNLKDLEQGKILVECCENTPFQEDFEGQFLMVESQIFFGSYYPVLKALKEFDESSFPLKRYLIEGKCDPQQPDYLESHASATYTVPLPKNRLKYNEEDVDVNPVVSFNIKDEGSWPAPAKLGFDASQHSAFKRALTQKVMLIQGPPGTGKTFMALKIVQTLLLNDLIWRTKKRPILVICYTNHALDQFLVGISAFTEDIVRVGGGCKEPDLEKYSVKKLQQDRLVGEHNLYKMLRDHRINFTEIKGSYESVGRAITLIKNNSGILDPETFFYHNVLERGCFNSFLSSEMFMSWLGGDARVNNNNFTSSPWFKLIHEFSETVLDYGWEEDGSKTVKYLLSFSKLEETISHLQKEKNCAHEFLKQQLLFYRHHLLKPLNDPANINFQRLSRLHTLWILPIEERWQLYRFWVNGLMQVLTKQLKELEPKYRHAACLLSAGRMDEERAIMASRRVIGMTTTYAASHQSILKQLKPPIVIVEEAAEVLESHIVVSLAGCVQHLILIGDHQQLKPNPAVFELASKYHLDVSLFERLLNNKLECLSLNTQHRMRPEIAKLICPAIYPNLVNHTSVQSFPNVRGVASNLFFLSHHQPEEEVQEIDSFKNTHEALFLSHLSRYLLLQGYGPSKITLLCAYKGQQFYLQKLRQKYPHLEGIRITAVDNYQGEENDIILLSLVRNNQDNAVGFLKIENRICVALSRARQGLFIVGNMKNLTAQGELWRKVKEELMKQNALGEEMVLRCEVHLTLTSVKTADDFVNCPEGGCLKQCGVLKPCGHNCLQMCHSTDRAHTQFQCMEPCERQSCEENHKCPGKCYQKCEKCNVPKTVLLSCGHSAEMPCHRDPEQYKCKAKITTKLTPCEHENKIYCYQSQLLTSVQCDSPCPIRLQCGHACENKCHLLRDPDHEKYKCQKACARKNFNCSKNHLCGKLCFEDCENCSIRVCKILDCGHQKTIECSQMPSRSLCGRKCRQVLACEHKCQKMCKDDCSPCLTQVLKRVPKCGHDQRMPCSQDPDSFKNCLAKCDKLLPCGHVCTNLCSTDCSVTCKERVYFPKVAGCGHKVTVPCHMVKSLEENHVELLKFCQQPCDALLQCTHHCKGTCGKCFQGRLHETCKQKCNKILVCGHPCYAFCSVSCPPCSKPCPVECVHSKCSKRCGEPCVPCKEACPRKCAHKVCLRPCGEVCTMDSCNIPCKNILSCKHKCISYCGEECLCRECNRDEVNTIFFGFEEEKGARFVKLPDCSHIFETSGLEKWMKQDDGHIKQMVCPKCLIPIMKSVRYDIKVHAADVAKVKLQVYGNSAQIKEVAFNTYKMLQFSSHFSEGFPQAQELLHTIKETLTRLLKTWPKESRQRWMTNPPLSLTEAKNLKEYSSILVTLHTLTSNVPKSSSLKDNQQKSFLLDEYRAEIESSLNALCGNLKKRSHVRLSDQEATDINKELERLSCLITVCEVQSSPNFKDMSSLSKISWDSISKVVRSLKPFPVDKKLEIKSKLDILLKEVYTNFKPSQKEIQAIRAAIGLKQGHWYKCPKGHIYAIGDCGRAYQTSKCPECGQTIGGQNHVLHQGNTPASEMVGAERAAWLM